MQSHPDYPLVREEFSIQSFNRFVKRLLTADGDGVYEFTRAVLAGRYEDERDGTQHRIIVRGLLGLTPPAECDYNDIPTSDEYSIARDYDSILGFSDNLPYSQPIGIYPIPQLAETLDKKVHVTYLCRTRSVSSPRAIVRSWLSWLL